MRINETSHREDKSELSALQFANATISKSLDQSVFTGHYLCKVKARLTGADTPGLGVAGSMHYFGGIQQGLGGHAAAQNAQTADIFPTLNHGGAEPMCRCGPRVRKTAAPAANHRHVVIESPLAIAHGPSIGQSRCHDKSVTCGGTCDVV